MPSAVSRRRWSGRRNPPVPSCRPGAIEQEVDQQGHGPPGAALLRAAEPGGHRAHILRHTRCSRHARPHVARPGGRRESATEPDNRASSRRSRLEGRSGGGPGRKLQHFGLRNQDRLPLRVKRAGHWVDSDWSESRRSGRKLQDVGVPQVLLPTCRGLARSEGFGRGRTTTMPRPSRVHRALSAASEWRKSRSRRCAHKSPRSRYP